MSRFLLCTLSWPILGGTGALAGLLLGKYFGDGKDNIFHPMLWMTPLGAITGLAAAAILVTIVAVQKR